jgi:Protein-tyrosine phosphatase
MRVELPGGAVVQAHGLSGFISTDEDEMADWALYLDEQWRERLIEWPHRFVDWPDFELPTDKTDAFEAIMEAWQRAKNGELVDVACDGGTGRTGTVLGCLAVLAGEQAAARPIEPPVLLTYNLGAKPEDGGTVALRGDLLPAR